MSMENQTAELRYEFICLFVLLKFLLWKWQFQVCVFGDISIPPSSTFLIKLLPIVILTITAHVCDKLTYKYVETNTFSRTSGGRMTKPNEDQENINTQNHPLSDHQNELLKIPLNAVRTSMFSILPFGIMIILRFLLINYSDFVRTQLFVTLICAMQGLRIVLEYRFFEFEKNILA